MKHSTIPSIGLAVLTGASLVSPARATTTIDTFGTEGNAFTMNFVDIDNPGNVNDIHGVGYGGVANAFRMSTYEVSRDMITKANTAGSLGITLNDLTSYGGNGANRPATGTSWNEAARFVNWLNVSSGSVAAYRFTTSGVNDNIVLWDATSAGSGYNAANPFRNSNAKYFLPSENEWYKAAYYDPNKPGGAGYWNYATGSDTAPNPVASGTASGTAVYGGQTGPANITSAGGLSPYGTMGQDGNVWELMETNLSGTNDVSSSLRGRRGGSWSSSDYPTVAYLNSSFRLDYSPSSEGTAMGFRVASSFSAIPEPTSLLSTLALVSSGLLLRRRTKALR
jgi:formylglycine-generating enzyme required for sulfatase activity